MRITSPDGAVTVEVVCLDGTDQLEVKNHLFYHTSVHTVDELVICLRDDFSIELADMTEQ